MRENGEISEVKILMNIGDEENKIGKKLITKKRCKKWSKKVLGWVIVGACGKMGDLMVYYFHIALKTYLN